MERADFSLRIRLHDGSLTSALRPSISVSSASTSSDRIERYFERKLETTAATDRGESLLD